MSDQPIIPGEPYTVPLEDCELLAFIAGRGKWLLVGNGVRTFPKGDDNDRALHAACERLEKAGRIFRCRDEPDRCYFIAR